MEKVGYYTVCPECRPEATSMLEWLDSEESEEGSVAEEEAIESDPAAPEETSDYESLGDSPQYSGEYCGRDRHYRKRKLISHDVRSSKKMKIQF